MQKNEMIFLRHVKRIVVENVRVNSPQEKENKTNRGDSEFDLLFMRKRKKQRRTMKSIAS